MLLTIVVPNYNNGKFIMRCIESITEYQGDKVEIIIIDDGSQDISKSILDKIKDSRVSVVYQSNQGVAVARNQGIKRSTGQYIMFIDADDYYLPCSIEKIIEYLSINITHDLVVFNVYKSLDNRSQGEIWNEKYIKELKKSEKVGKLIELLYKSDQLNSPCNKIYNTEIIKQNGVMFPKNVKTGEDGIYNIAYGINCNNLSVIDEVFYSYQYGMGEYTSEKINAPCDRIMHLEEKYKLRYKYLEEYLIKKKINLRVEKKLKKYLEWYVVLQIYEDTKRVKISDFAEISNLINRNPFLQKSLKVTYGKEIGVKNLIKYLILITKITTDKLLK